MSEYCNCSVRDALTSEIGEFGYWDVCTKCHKRIEGSYHSYNHYDGRDHCDIDEDYEDDFDDDLDL